MATVRCSVNQPVFYCRATAGQEAVFFEHQADPTSRAYSYPFSWQFTGPSVDAGSLMNALRSVIGRHVSLRASFKVNPLTGRVEMLERPLEDIEIESYDVRRYTSLVADCCIARHTQRLAGEPFNLTEQSSLFAVMVRKSQEVILFANFHHIIIDGYSLDVLIRDLLCSLNGDQFKQLRATYDDYASSENARLDDSAFVLPLLEFWKGMLKDIPTRIQFPVSSQQQEPTRSAHTTTQMSTQMSSLVNFLSQSCQVTPFAMLLAVFGLLMGRMCNTNDLIVGTATANRLRSDVKDIVGFFSRLVPVRINMRDRPTFKTFVQRVMFLLGDILEHQEIPLSMVTEALGICPRTRHESFIQCTMTYQGEVLTKRRVSVCDQETEIEFKHVDKPDCKVDLEVEVAFDNGWYRFEWEYSTALFDYTFVYDLNRRMELIVQSAAQNINAVVHDLPITLTWEKRELLDKWNGKHRCWGKATVNGLVEDQCKRTPDKPAVQCKDNSITYSQLNEKADHLAAVIQKNIGSKPHVGILQDRSIELVVAVLAILKAGAAYVPLATNYPKQRLQHILKETGCSLVVTETSYTHLLTGYRGHVLFSDQLAHSGYDSRSEDTYRPTADQSLAYIMYTSGSTGKPKGVKCRHSSIINVLLYMNQTYWKDNDDTLSKTMFSSSICFDAHCEEIFLPLITGGCVVVVDSILNPEEGVTYISGTPSAMSLISIPSSVKACVLGGEAITMACWRNIEHIPIVVNTYGPTECTIECTTMSPVLPDRLNRIGRPIANATVYVLDSRMQVVPVGVRGELYVGGDCLSDGYVDQPEYTALRFIKNPFREGRLYKTGDLARWLPDSTLEYIGRADDQVKIRGMRVELGEIEQHLMAQPGVKQAHVTMTGDSSTAQHLAAYIAPDTVDTNTIRTSLEASLPAHMIPTAFHLLDRLPLTQQNKVDKSALPPPQIHPTDCAQMESLPHLPLDVSATAGRILCYYKFVFGIDAIQIDDNFFQLGGHSLLALRLLHKIRDKEDANISVHDILTSPSPRRLAQTLHHLKSSRSPQTHSQRPSQYSSTIKPSQSFPLCLMQQRLVKLHQQHQSLPVLNIYFALQLTHKIENQRLIEIVKSLVDRHTSLRTLIRPDKDGKLQQYIQNSKAMCINFKRLNSDLLMDELSALSVKPCDLATNLFDCTILDASTGDKPNQVIHIRSHHAIMDGHSTAVFYRELILLLNDQQLEPNPLQHHQYCCWQEDHMISGGMKQQLNFWKSYLTSAAFMTPLPYKTADTSQMDSCFGDRVVSTEDQDLKQQVEHLCALVSTSQATVLLTAFAIAISSFCTCKDVLIGYRTANRQPEATNAIGCFYNVVPVRFQLKPSQTFMDCIKKTIRDLERIQENSDVTVLQIAQSLNLNTDRLYTSVYQVSFNYEAYRDDPRDVPTAIKVSVIPLELSQVMAVSDIVLDASNTEHGFRLRWSYNKEKLSRETVASLVHHFRAVMSRMLQDPTLRVTEVVDS